MSFPNSSMKRKNVAVATTHQNKVRFASKDEFPTLSDSKTTPPQYWGKTPTINEPEGDWTSGRLVHSPDEQETLRFESPETIVFSNKSVEKLNWEKRNALMQEIYKCRAYGMRKSLGPNWDTYVENAYVEEDEDWYRIEEEDN